jgi:predicted secreted hydrolase
MNGRPTRLMVSDTPPRPSRSLRLAGCTIAFVVACFASVGTPAGNAAEIFATPQPGRDFAFPRDHGSHPEFRLEWWYVTGHLWDGSSNRYGFQATFFRTAAPQVTPSAADLPGFGRHHLFLAHMALLEVGTGRFLHQERLNRQGWDAGSSAQTLAVTNGNWRLALEPGPDHPARLRLQGSIRGDASFQLNLEAAKPLVVFGTNGVSRKGADPGAASHYLTFPRLSVTGELRLSGEPRSVRGQAWMDHEFSSSQLESDQAGWDWLSIQLHDGREVMAYRMRLKDGGTDEFSTLAWVDRDGRVTHFGADDFALEPLTRWRSPRTGADYPLGFRLRTTNPATGTVIQWRIEPLARDQELSGAIGGVPYWEGASRVLDDAGQEIGSAFVELTGYSGNLSDRLR